MGRFRCAVVASVVLVLGVGAAGCLPPLAPSPSPKVEGQFVAECPFDHRGTLDPIVAPGSTTFWHEHDFFGNTHTDQNSIPEAFAGRTRRASPRSTRRATGCRRC